jgi:hypothetical protein
MTNNTVRDLTLSDIVVIAGASSATSPWELWHTLKGNLEETKIVSSRGEWAGNLKSAIGDGIQARYNAVLQNSIEVSGKDTHVFPFNNHVIQIPEIYYVKDKGNLPLDLGSKILFIRQIGSESYRFGWNKLENQIPEAERIKAHIHMMLHRKVSCAVFLLIDGGESEDVFEVTLDRELAVNINHKVADFIRSLDLDEEPDIDYSRERKNLQALYQPQEGTSIDFSENQDVINLVAEYEIASNKYTALNRQSELAKKEKTTIENKLKDLARTNETLIISPNTKLQFENVHRKASQVAASTYQKIKILNSGN